MMDAARQDASRIAADTLRRHAADIFERTGMSRQHAEVVAGVLVWADLRGIESHGVARIPTYLRWIAAGDMNPRPVIKHYRKTTASLVIDADRAPGPVAMMEAVPVAMEMARESGIAMVHISHTTHTAALGYYTHAAACKGMVGIALAASSPLMAYHGAKVAGVSTSPISIAVPQGEEAPVVLDMSTGAVSLGRLLMAGQRGEIIPEGWALDANGNSTTEGAAAKIPLPMSGPKGSGLALMIELIVSLLAANPLLADTLEGGGAGRRHRQNALFMAINVAHLVNPLEFAAQVRRLMAAIKNLPAQDPDIGILLPGERAQRETQRRTRDGIPLSGKVRAEIVREAARLGLAAL